MIHISHLLFLSYILFLVGVSTISLDEFSNMVISYDIISTIRYASPSAVHLQLSDGEILVHAGEISGTFEDDVFCITGVAFSQKLHLNQSKISLCRTEDEVNGLLLDNGNAVWHIESLEHDLAVIYRDSDIINQSHSGICSNSAHPDADDIALADAPSLAKRTVQPKRICMLSIYVTPEFRRRFPGKNIKQEVLSIVQDVSLIYSSQLNLNLVVSKTAFLASAFFDNQSSIETVLKRFTDALISEKKKPMACASHLLSGGDYGLSLGLTYRGQVCQKYATGVSTFKKDSLRSVFVRTLAHELGHTFGASHDTDYSALCSAGKYLMQPVIDMQSPNGSKFSRCSLNAIADTLKNCTCL